jgi:transcriptional regulator with XRE-family HTH domain
VQESISETLSALRSTARLSQEALARLLGVSFVSINRWERGASVPSPAQVAKIRHLKQQLEATGALPAPESQSGVFASHGARRKTAILPLFQDQIKLELASEPGAPVLDRLIVDGIFSSAGREAIGQLLSRHPNPARTASQPPAGGVSAGKNSYTYDAHTYHTKVPPQGIAEIIQHYLPERGLVLDPFGGSGMTGVAALATGNDCIINELSPAACFIADRFLTRLDSDVFRAAVTTVLAETEEVRRRLYTTACRECGKETEILYTVWSYRVICSSCGGDFQLWDVCRRYGKRVRDHKILKEFPCPSCHTRLTKSRLVRTIAEPVQLGYMCCGSRHQEVVHPLTPEDLQSIVAVNAKPPLVPGFYPTTPIPDGVNLSQPKRHGLTHIDRFYTLRNLAALSHIWATIHRFSNRDLAAHLAFTFTSLYQRVTTLSEFRFWGGSGNTARFNVPFIYNE